jgi:KDO2-lipid IV(A) lauroyltransferase
MKKFAQALVFYLTLPSIFIISILPWPILFLVSDFFFVIVYYAMAYRRKIVRTNLSNSFPEKSVKELKDIEFRFYRFFIDLTFETFKLFTLSSRQRYLHGKMDEGALALFADLYSKQKSIVMIMGHYGNWEYCPWGSPLHPAYQTYAIFHPLSSPFFNQWMLRFRTNTGCKLYPMAGTLKGMLANRHELNATLFISDQAPNPNGAAWLQFLNQETPVYTGPEKIAQKLNMAVVYGSMQRVKRGNYIFRVQLICEDASKTATGEITETHTRLLENDIQNVPEYWLWTHRRWKHKRPQRQINEG